MSLRKGDHLVIRRDGVILTPDAGEYREFEVIDTPPILRRPFEHVMPGEAHTYYQPLIKVVK